MTLTMMAERHCYVIYAKNHSTECQLQALYVEYRHAECHYAKCRYAECLGANGTDQSEHSGSS